MSPDAPRVAALVLAAGRGTRMRSALPSKLLYPLDGVPVVWRSVETALAARAAPVVVVTGHEAARVEAALAARAGELSFVRNPDYAGGLSTSLRAGLAALEAHAVDAALVCLGDMPWVRPASLDALVTSFTRARDPAPVCVPVHEGVRGNPVLWPARHFGALCTLEGDAGGRSLLRRLAAQVCEVAVDDPGVRRDVDVPEDLG